MCTQDLCKPYTYGEHAYKQQRHVNKTCVSFGIYHNDTTFNDEILPPKGIG